MISDKRLAEIRQTADHLHFMTVSDDLRELLAALEEVNAAWCEEARRNQRLTEALKGSAIMRDDEILPGPAVVVEFDSARKADRFKALLLAFAKGKQ